MKAVQVSTLPDQIRNEVARLKGAGLSLLPLGGADGKTPLLRSWTDNPLPLARIFAPMHRSGSQAYGVRLDGLAVIDCDCDDADLVAQLEARFGRSRCMSKRHAVGICITERRAPCRTCAVKVCR